MSPCPREVCLGRFNEAEAIKPRKHAAIRMRPKRKENRFNEAEAIKPRKLNSAIVPTYMVMGLQ